MKRSAPWRQATERVLALRDEAAGFLERAAQRFAAASRDHFPLVARLWLAAEDADPLMHCLLEGMNRELLRGKGEIDVSRGGYVLEPAATGKPAEMGAPSLPDIDWQAIGFPQSPFLRAQPPAVNALQAAPPTAEEELVYNCTWSLRWDSSRAVTLDLGITADEGRLSLRVLGERSHNQQHLCYPVPEESVQAALAAAYVAERLADEAPKTRVRKTPAKPAPLPSKAKKRAAKAKLSR
ncbi:MAG: hypothetical protein EXR47_05830 [Dehalococcoidia bacterium]|nr:hypothetical protein [Dehalococcoidia bacterium]